jgi:cytochrome c2
MTKRNHIPWDKRPLTAMDFAVTTAIGVFLIVLASGGLFFFLLRGDGNDGAAAPPPQAVNQIAPQAETQPTPGPTTEAVVGGSEAISRGAALFEEKCVACHTIGRGPTVGPDLEGVVESRERDWLLEWIQNPDEMLAEGDPLASQMLEEWNNLAMPDLEITEEGASDILAYIQQESGGVPEPQTAEEPAPAEPEPTQELSTASIEGDADIGEDLFVGRTALTDGGPACISCHEVSDLGALGGGTLGPNLTDVADRLGPQGLTASLQSLPFPSMQPIYADRPLTDVEVAHLTAFFMQTEAPATAETNYTFVLIGIAGLVVATPITHLIWRHRFKGVRKPLVGR